MLSVSLVFCAIVALATALEAGLTAVVLQVSRFTQINARLILMQARCQSFGGNLASVHSDEEYAFIQTLTQVPTWLGGTDCQRTGAWFWIDGTPMMYRFWCLLKPDNDLKQCCLQMNTGGHKS
nr:type-2 ice-structuring protein-like [Nerophis lumbriciformis]